MQENGLIKFRTIVSEVSSFVGNPVCLHYTDTQGNPQLMGLQRRLNGIYADFLLTVLQFPGTRARDLKTSGKYGSGLSCRWTLFTARAFGLKMHLIFHRVELKNWFNILFG